MLALDVGMVAERSVVADGDVDTAGAQLLKYSIEGSSAHLDADLRMPAHERGDGFQQQVLERAGTHADSQHVRVGIASRHRTFEQCVGIVEKSRRPFDEKLALIGEYHAARRALEYRITELPFQLSHAFGQRGLRNADVLGRNSEGAVARGCHNMIESSIDHEPQPTIAMHSGNGRAA